MKFAQKHPFRNGSLLLLQGSRERARDRVGNTSKPIAKMALKVRYAGTNRSHGFQGNYCQHHSGSKLDWPALSGIGYSAYAPSALSQPLDQIKLAQSVEAGI